MYHTVATSSYTNVCTCLEMSVVNDILYVGVCACVCVHVCVCMCVCVCVCVVCVWCVCVCVHVCTHAQVYDEVCMCI